MPALSDLQRQILTNIIPRLGALTGQNQPPTSSPDDLQGYPLGYANSRRAPTHPPMVVVPDKSWSATDAAYHLGSSDPDQGFMTTAHSALLNLFNKISGRETPYSQQIDADFQKGGPTIAVPESRVNSPVFRHEATHALLNGVDTQLPRQQVLDLIPHQGLDPLRKVGYNDEELTKEIPARLITEPITLNMSDTEGHDAAMKYAQMLEQQGHKQLADKYRNYFGLASTTSAPQVTRPQGYDRDEASFQPPNEVF